MALRNNEIIVIDVESTCWESHPPVGMHNEIIEIGIAIIDVNQLIVSETGGIFVKPTVSEIGPFCTSLTGLTNEDVKNARSFAEALSFLEDKYPVKSCPWASYGDYDRTQFERQCNRENKNYPFCKTHINIKNLVAVFCGIKKEIGMLSAMKLFNIQHKGTHHRANDDAKNIAEILIALLKKFRS